MELMIDGVPENLSHRHSIYTSHVSVYVSHVSLHMSHVSLYV